MDRTNFLLQYTHITKTLNTLPVGRRTPRCSVYVGVIFKGEKVTRSRKEIENDLRNGLHPDDPPSKYCSYKNMPPIFRNE